MVIDLCKFGFVFDECGKLRQLENACSKSSARINTIALFLGAISLIQGDLVMRVVLRTKLKKYFIHSKTNNFSIVRSLIGLGF